jgi:hypothetical protein
MLRTLALVSMLFPPLPALAQLEARPINGTAKVVNGGPGDQTDPHVSGALVAYTNEASGRSEIRYHDLVTGQDAAIPNGGAFDFVSDVSGSTVVFTRVSASSSIYTYDVGTESTPVEVAPEEGCNRRSAVIGGRTVAWQDFGFTSSSQQPEIVAYDLDRRTLTRLTNDTLQDRTPAVAPDGRTVVWAKCDAQGLRCDIWEARWNGSGFTTQALTGTEGEESQPDTNGQLVVYASTRPVEGGSDRDIYWKPVGGGTEQRLALPGLDANPSISGSLVAFERRAPGRTDSDIALYDLKSQTLYQLTSSLENESLNDLSVSADGTVRVVWTALTNGDFNVHSLTFRLAEEPQCIPQEKQGRLPIDVCYEPGDWPLLTSVEVRRTTGAPDGAEFHFAGSGAGVLCVDNGYSGTPATSGWVWLNGHVKVTPAQFQPGDALIATGIVMDAEGGNNTLTATISGNPGSMYRLRLYAMPPLCEEEDDAAGQPEDAEPIPGQPVAPLPLGTEAGSSLTFVPEGAVAVRGPQAGGCSASGGSLALVGLMVLAQWLAGPRPRRAVVLSRRKELRRERRAL